MVGMKIIAAKFTQRANGLIVWIGPIFCSLDSRPERLGKRVFFWPLGCRVWSRFGARRPGLPRHDMEYVGGFPELLSRTWSKALSINKGSNWQE